MPRASVIYLFVNSLALAFESKQSATFFSVWEDRIRAHLASFLYVSDIVFFFVNYSSGKENIDYNIYLFYNINSKSFGYYVFE